MEAQEIKVQKILELDLLIDQDYPSDPILQKCYVWYVVIIYKFLIGFPKIVIRFSEDSQTTGMKWHKGLGLDTLVTRMYGTIRLYI